MRLQSLKSKLLLAVSALVIGSGLLIMLLVSQSYSNSLLDLATAQGENLAHAVALDATDTNTLGSLAVNVMAAGCRNFTDVVEVVTDTLEDMDGLVKRSLGLNLENYYLDNITYSSGKLAGARIRIYDTAGNVGSATGVVASYNVTATYSGTDLSTYKVVKA